MVLLTRHEESIKARLCFAFSINLSNNNLEYFSNHFHYNTLQALNLCLRYYWCLLWLLLLLCRKIEQAAFDHLIEMAYRKRLVINIPLSTFYLFSQDLQISLPFWYLILLRFTRLVINIPLVIKSRAFLILDYTCLDLLYSHVEQHIWLLCILQIL